MAIEDDFNLISFKELCCYFDRDHRTVRRWLQKHGIQPLKPFDDRNVYYCRKTVQNALKESTTED